MFKKILFFFIFSIIFIPQIIQAQENSAFGIGNLNRAVGGIGLEEDLESSVANIIRSVLVVTGTIFLILVVAAGILWMTAAGNPEKIKTAKSIVIGATIGLLIILSAYLITSFIAKSVDPSTKQPKEGICEGRCIDKSNSCNEGENDSGQKNCGKDQKCCSN